MTPPLRQPASCRLDPKTGQWQVKDLTGRTIGWTRIRPNLPENRKGGPRMHLGRVQPVNR